MQPGALYQNRLNSSYGFQPQALVACGLRPTGGATDHLPENTVEQSRLSHVGPPHDGDIAAACYTLVHLTRWSSSFHAPSSNRTATRASCAATCSARRRLLPLPIVASFRASTTPRT